MSTPSGTFTFRKAVRDGSSPLLIGLIGPSGGGKTMSALRLATGIVSFRGGKIAAIDTEANRMLHYADNFDFQHLSFCPPFSSERYLLALTEAARVANGGVVIVDSMSHEHEGQGGYLEYHETELDRLAGDDWKKRDRVNFTAWIKPSSARRRLINSLLQLNCSFIFCFRAKEKLKLIPGKNPEPLGWQAIAGDEFGFEMTVRCLLPPGANGIPDWTPESFKYQAAKRPDDFKVIFEDGKQLTEEVGGAAANWAKGNKPNGSPLPISSQMADKRREHEQRIKASLITLYGDDKKAMGAKLVELTSWEKDGKKFPGMADYTKIKSDKSVEILCHKLEKLADAASSSHHRQLSCPDYGNITEDFCADGCKGDEKYREDCPARK